jgi:hypothetical protein
MFRPYTDTSPHPGGDCHSFGAEERVCQADCFLHHRVNMPHYCAVGKEKTHPSSAAPTEAALSDPGCA